MKILVTGSAGHLGEALVRTLRASNHHPIGVDIHQSSYTDLVGSIVDRSFVHQAIAGCEAVIHCATLHKPHVATHSRQDFVDTNVTGTLNLLEEAAASDCRTFVYTSTTSTFGHAMRTEPGAPAVWVTEQLQPKPKNIYGATKTAAEDLCELFSRNTDLACLVLKTSRFFAEADDAPSLRDALDDTNLKVVELLFRRVDIADVVSAHQLALAKAHSIGFQKLIISATTPFQPTDATELGLNAAAVLAKRMPHYLDEFQRRDWQILPRLDRVYDNAKARKLLGWTPKYSFAQALALLTQGVDHTSELAQAIWIKPYHPHEFDDGPYPIGNF